MSDVPPPPPPPPPPPGGFGAPPPASSPDVGAALSYGWKKFQQYVGVAIAVILIPFAIQIVLGVIGQAAIRSSIFLYLLIEILSFVVSAVAAYGIYHVALM